MPNAAARARGGVVRGRAGGFTIVEVVVAVAMAVTVLGAVLSVVFHSQLMVGESMRNLEMDQRGYRTLDRIADVLRAASPPTITPIVLSNSSTIQFQEVVGYSGGAVQLGPVTTISFDPAPGETFNGADDNGDGRADEGAVVFTTSGQTGVPIAGDVMGLRFSSTATGITFSVDIGKTGRDGQPVTRTYTREISLRNG